MGVIRPRHRRRRLVVVRAGERERLGDGNVLVGKANGYRRTYCTTAPSERGTKMTLTICLKPKHQTSKT